MESAKGGCGPRLGGPGQGAACHFDANSSPIGKVTWGPGRTATSDSVEPTQRIFSEGHRRQLAQLLVGLRALVTDGLFDPVWPHHSMRGVSSLRHPVHREENRRGN